MQALLIFLLLPIEGEHQSELSAGFNYSQVPA
jgi:hypothetical protein